MGPCFADLCSASSSWWFRELSKVKSLVLLFETFFALRWEDVDVQVDGLGKMGKVEGPWIRTEGLLPVTLWLAPTDMELGEHSSSSLWATSQVTSGCQYCGSAVAETIP